MQKRFQSQVEFSAEELQILHHLFPSGICAFDFEMTGLSPIFDKIIEIAAVKISANKNIEYYHSFVNPLIEIPEHTKQYHGLDNKDLRDAPSLRTPLKDFQSFYGNLPLLAHNAMFDSSFLIKGLHEFGIPIGLSDVFDSCRLARGFFKQHEGAPVNYKLSTLADFFDIKFKHHRALDDATVSLKIFAQICLQLRGQNKISRLRELGYLFKLKDFKKKDRYILPPKLSPLRNYLAQKTPIEIKYMGGKQKGEFRPVCPIAILPLPQGLILYAECLKDNMNKYFQIKKVKAMRELA